MLTAPTNVSTASLDDFLAVADSIAAERSQLLDQEEAGKAVKEKIPGRDNGLFSFPVTSTQVLSIHSFNSVYRN